MRKMAKFSDGMLNCETYDNLYDGAFPILVKCSAPAECQIQYRIANSTNKF